MVPILSEIWRMAAYLASPETETSPMPTGSRRGERLLGAAKTLLWAAASVLAGLALGRLS